MAAPRVVVLGQDLIWQTRLADALASIGARPVRARTVRELDHELPCADALVVDLAARSFDPVDSIARAANRGVAVLALGPHDDRELRRRALAAGAERVLAYRKLFEGGPATLAAWLERAGRAAGARPAVGAGGT